MAKKLSQKIASKKLHHCCKNGKYRYICTVQSTPTNFYQKIISLLLLGLFVIVHGVKVFHSHTSKESTATLKIKVDGALIKTSDKCTICDYHLANGAVPVTNTYTIKSPDFKTSIKKTQSSFAVITSIGSVATDRGPPSLA
ncbi:hypothetical protein EXU57_09175 [Segetibacter sp. 3557_3]|uniref:hypothetical protein n=1 Tax=Segetibacter sp. 3557_3 TaxID=2547429 RepID=UPI00105889E1|nr:hypothetical protein [Segetibacter sp. 3557_3]TDH26965.1 hypothetical protein EXU57_09175 [Segetibacter sp. 3557_3]